ncbi:MAG: hypothetical protein ABMA64_27770, partial [Myxococcota bacterium]
RAKSGTVSVRARPKPDGKEIASLSAGAIVRDGHQMCDGSGRDQCATVAWGYEALGLPVYTLRDGWAEIGLGKGGGALEPAARCRNRGWVELDPPMEVYTVEDLLDDHGLTHTLDGWDGQLYDRPAGTPRASGFTDQVDFELRGTRTVTGELWLEVDLVDAHCEGDKRSRGAGWIPAADPRGTLQVWYYTDC